MYGCVHDVIVLFSQVRRSYGPGNGGRFRRKHANTAEGFTIRKTGNGSSDENDTSWQNHRPIVPLPNTNILGAGQNYQWICSYDRVSPFRRFIWNILRVKSVVLCPRSVNRSIIRYSRWSFCGSTSILLLAIVATLARSIEIQPLCFCKSVHRKTS